MFPKHHNVKWKSSRYDLVGYTSFWIHWMEGKINPVNWKHCKIWMKRTGPWGVTAMLELVGCGNKNHNITHKNICNQNNNSKYCSVKLEWKWVMNMCILVYDKFKLISFYKTENGLVKMALFRSNAFQVLTFFIFRLILGNI